MQTRSLEAGCQIVLSIFTNSMNAGNGILLAMDGSCNEMPKLLHVLQQCKWSGYRLDILLLNPVKPATLILGKFLQQLEKEDVDYRLSSGYGEWATELPLYLHRFNYLSFVLLDCLNKLEKSLHPTLDALHQEGYKLLTLISAPFGLKQPA